MRRAVVAMVLAALVCASCTSTPTTSPRSTGSTSTSTTSTTRPPSALDNLTAFFTAAADIDQGLKAAAVDANGAIGTTEITISQSTLDAIAAADPTPAAQDIPAGLPPDVLLPVLTVQSDLVSRFYAFRGFVQAQPGTIPRTNPLPGSLSAADYLLTLPGQWEQGGQLILRRRGRRPDGSVPRATGRPGRPQLASRCRSRHMAASHPRGQLGVR